MSCIILYNIVCAQSFDAVTEIGRPPPPPPPPTSSTVAAADASAVGPMDDRRRVLPSTTYPRHRFSRRGPSAVVAAVAAAATIRRRQRLRSVRTSIPSTEPIRTPLHSLPPRAHRPTHTTHVVHVPLHHHDDRRRQTARALHRRSRCSRRTAVPQPGPAARCHSRRSRGPHGTRRTQPRRSGLLGPVPCVQPDPLPRSKRKFIQSFSLIPPPVPLCLLH